tara:strand:- start:2638 stop:3198 length:561 start_codon:yes stop_codon:yes gene_type:complete
MNKLDELKIKIAEPPQKIVVKIEPLPSEEIKLDIRRTLNDDYMVYDHPLFDIVLMPKKNKIVTFAKKNGKIDAYPYQDHFFNFLQTKGVILPDTVQAGNVLGSLEAVYPINEKVDSIQAILLTIYVWLKEEVPKAKRVLDYEHEIEDEYTDPSSEDSTEYGEVPQEKQKGTLDPFYTQYYGLLYRI